MVYERLSANGCALNATSKGDIQRSMDLFSAACENFRLVMDTAKTVVMYQSPPDADYVAPQINVNGAQLQAVDNLISLDRALSRTTKIDDKVACRTSKVSQVFGRLESTVCNRHGVHRNTKLKMYKTVILPALLYGAETWTVYKS
nr:unnamed protein product [Spirometra erinaceieuropaei]